MVRRKLSRVGKLHGHAVEQAGFVVLKTAGIPSILVEIGFISNPREEKKLLSSSYQKKIVKGIKDAVVQYARKYPWGQDSWRTVSN
jgi:N-acetylmuramoyl-L-alanine amidase